MKKRGIVSTSWEESAVVWGPSGAKLCIQTEALLKPDTAEPSPLMCMCLPACSACLTAASCAPPAARQTFLEMLSMELKGDGLYVSRGLSFR